jgi:catechol 2,3-dioxygenase-like lactoylglutathione lyase family enzyme
MRPARPFASTKKSRVYHRNVKRTLLSVEIIVDSLDRALEFLIDILGCELIERRPSENPVGELALVDVGSTVLSLLEPSSAGPGYILPIRDPRVSQLVFSTTGDDDHAEHGCINAGLAVAHLTGGGWYLPPQVVAGALGLSTAIVVTPVAADA